MAMMFAHLVPVCKTPHHNFQLVQLRLFCLLRYTIELWLMIGKQCLYNAVTVTVTV